MLAWTKWGLATELASARRKPRNLWISILGVVYLARNVATNTATFLAETATDAANSGTPVVTSLDGRCVWQRRIGDE